MVIYICYFIKQKNNETGYMRFSSFILIDCAFLQDWRGVMQDLTGSIEWAESIKGLSPIESVAQLNPETKINLFVGDKDVVTPSFLSTAFAKEVNKRVTLKIIEGANHEFILKPKTLSLILDSIQF